MPQYKITAVSQAAQGGEGDRKWTRQTLTLQNNAGATKDVSLFCNRFTPVPKVGDTIEGEVKPNEKNPNWLPELHLPKRGGGPQKRVEDPATRASIAMQASQKVAVDLAKFAFENNLDDAQRMRLMNLHKDFSGAVFAQVMEAQKNAQ